MVSVVVSQSHLTFYLCIRHSTVMKYFSILKYFQSLKLRGFLGRQQVVPFSVIRTSVFCRIIGNDSQAGMNSLNKPIRCHSSQARDVC